MAKSTEAALAQVLDHLQVAQLCIEGMGQSPAELLGVADANLDVAHEMLRIELRTAEARRSGAVPPRTASDDEINQK